MKFATNQADRIALIKEIAERKKKLSRIKAKSKGTLAKVKLDSVPRKKPKNTINALDDTSQNPNYYTDSSKYAKQYYGETMYETTRFDNDWGDY